MEKERQSRCPSRRSVAPAWTPPGGHTDDMGAHPRPRSRCATRARRPARCRSLGAFGQVFPEWRSFEAWAHLMGEPTVKGEFRLAVFVSIHPLILESRESTLAWEYPRKL